jgi:hypothetical protein
MIEGSLGVAEIPSIVLPNVKTHIPENWVTDLTELPAATGEDVKRIEAVIGDSRNYLPIMASDVITKPSYSMRFANCNGAVIMSRFPDVLETGFMHACYPGGEPHDYVGELLDDKRLGKSPNCSQSLSGAMKGI